MAFSRSKNAGYKPRSRRLLEVTDWTPTHSAEMKSSRPRLTPSRPHQIRPGFTAQQPNSVPPQLQLNCHVTSGVAYNASYARIGLAIHVRLSALYRDHLGSVSAESDLAIAEASQYSTSQILRHFASHRITFEHTVSLRRIDLGSSTDPLYAFDPEIELTLRRLRKIRNTLVNTSSSSDSAINSNLSSANTLVASSNIFAEPRQMENNDRTLKELATPDVVYQPWCIQYPQLEPAQTYELKSGLIHLLPKFHGLAGEDPHKHLKELHVFFPASRTTSIRNEICGIRQHAGETLHEYWERFNKLCATCPHHQISEQLLIQYFYEGLLMMDRSMIDAANGGALMDKTPTAARHLISNMASNTQ
ncbi:hypothetical protein CR513_47270, partial [Mucuna pruriens]